MPDSTIPSLPCARGVLQPLLAVFRIRRWNAVQFQVRLEQVGRMVSLLMVKLLTGLSALGRSNIGHLADRFAKSDANDRKNSTVPIRASARNGCRTVSRPAPR